MACHYAPLRALCHNIVCCIVTQHHIWDVAHSSFPFSTFFFTHFFFICSTHCKITKRIYISFFFPHLQVEPKNIYLYIYIYIPFLHIVKLQKKKKISSTHFFFHLILDYFAQNFSNPKPQGLYFLNLNVPHFLQYYSPSIHSHITYNTSCYTPKHT